MMKFIPRQPYRKKSAIHNRYLLIIGILGAVLGSLWGGLSAMAGTRPSESLAQAPAPLTPREESIVLPEIGTEIPQPGLPVPNPEETMSDALAAGDCSSLSWFFSLFPGDFVVDQAEPQSIQAYNFSSSANRYYKYFKIEDALACAPPGQTILLCPGHTAATTINQNVILQPVSDPAICATGETVLEPIPDLRGARCYGGDYDCNRCVNDLEGQFSRLSSNRGEYAFDLADHPDPPFSILTKYHGHWQGVQRLPNDNDYLLVTRDIIDHDGSQWSGFALVKDSRVQETIYITDEHNHPGGVQVMGDYLAVGTGSILHFYDVSDPASMAPHQSAIGRLPERTGFSGSSTSLAQLKDGRFLLVISSSNAEPLDFYISDSPSWSSFYGDPAGFSKIDRVDKSEIKTTGEGFKEGKWDAFQSINLVTDCTTRKLYLIGTGNNDLVSVGKLSVPTAEDWAQLYRLDVSGNSIQVTKVAEKYFPMDRMTWTPDLVDDLLEFLPYNDVLDTVDWILQEDRGNFDAAAGVYVDGNGRLYLYTTQHGWVMGWDGKHFTNFTEFGPSYGDRIEMPQPYVTPIPGDDAIVLVLELGNATYNGSKYLVYKSGELVGEYVISPVSDFGGWIVDSVTFWDFLGTGSTQADGTIDSSAVPPIGTTFYYTVTLQDEFGNESPPSDVVSATVGMLHLEVPDAFGPPGGTVQVPVVTPNSYGLAICQADIRLQYDPLILEPTGITTSTLVPDTLWSSQVITPGLVQAVVSTTMGTELFGSGALFNFQFDVIGGAGTTSTLNIPAAGTAIYDCDRGATPLLLDLGKPALFTASLEGFPGDLDMNGAVEAADGDLALEIAVSGQEPTETQMAAGNLNQDGRISAGDAVLIMRAAAGLPGLLPSSITAAQAETVTLGLPADVQLPQEGSTWVPLSIDDATGVAGVDIMLAYDPLVVTFMGAQTTTLSAGFDLAANEPIPGQVWLALKPKAGYEDGLGSGSGSFVEVLFEDREQAQGNASTPLNLLFTRLSDRYGRDFARSSLQVGVVLVDGSLSVGDNLPPYLIVTDPSDGSYTNDLYEPISIAFNEAMDAGSLDVQSTPSLVYTTSWSENGQVAYLHHGGLGSSTVYTFTVSGSDLTTIPMTETVTWVFTTTFVDEVAPAVLGAFPENGGLGVVLTPTIQITFSEQIPPGDAFIEITPDPIGAHNYDLSMNATWNDTRTIMTTTVDFPLFPETTYTIRVDASDRSGNPLAAPFQWSFTTLRAERNVYLPFVTR